jgi:hypothetical protein
MSTDLLLFLLFVTSISTGFLFVERCRHLTEVKTAKAACVAFEEELDVVDQKHEKELNIVNQEYTTKLNATERSIKYLESQLERSERSNAYYAEKHWRERR